MMKSPLCPLCNVVSTAAQAVESFDREFLNCNHCSLIFASADNFPNTSTEKSRYENHKNSIEDVGYVKFLSQAIEPALPHISSSSDILDYGCGPQPVLSQLLKQKAYQCSNYDPYFFPQQPTGKYDVIFSTEVFEHFHNPKMEIEKITDLLAPNGLLVVMTEFYKNHEHFKDWWYTRDFTHVCFYNEESFQYISEHFGYSMEYTDHQRVIILKRTKS